MRAFAKQIQADRSSPDGINSALEILRCQGVK
jgi:hypothetical protein